MSDYDSDSDMSMAGGGVRRKRPLSAYNKYMSKKLRELRKAALKAGKNPKQTSLMVQAAKMWSAKTPTKKKAKAVKRTKAKK
jgi:predicted NAD/FAD-dependent oxidoreductase